MLTNKNKLIGLALVIALVGLICSSVIAFISIDNAKKENEMAQVKITELNNSIDLLEASLKDTNKDISEHEERINKYQEIFSAWTKATPIVKEAIDKIMAFYGDVTFNSHLFPTEKLEGLEDEMMNAVYTAIRSTDPLSVAADFEKVIAKANESRFDNVLKAKLEAIKENGVTYPEDADGVNDARAYYDKFLNNYAVIKSFVERELDKELARIEALLDADEEDDLSKAFEEAVAKINAPITLKTSLSEANASWDALYAVLESDDILADATIKARILLDNYSVRANELARAKLVADAINSKIENLKITPDITTKTFIDGLEKEINAWINDFKIDEANMYLISDLTPVKNAYESAVSELRALYEAYNRAVTNIGDVNINSKATINFAFEAYNAIKNYRDTDKLLGLESPNTVAELYAVLQSAANEYNYLISLVDAIRAEIDRLLKVDLGVTQSDVDALELKINELISLDAPLKVINTETVDYIARLDAVRLLPSKNAAQEQIKDKYDDYCDKANNCCDLIKALVEIKDAALCLIENAQSVDDILTSVQKALDEFASCFN